MLRTVSVINRKLLPTGKQNNTYETEKLLSRNPSQPRHGSARDLSGSSVSACMRNLLIQH